MPLHFPQNTFADYQHINIMWETGLLTQSMCTPVILYGTQLSISRLRWNRLLCEWSICEVYDVWRPGSDLAAPHSEAPSSAQQGLESDDTKLPREGRRVRAYRWMMGQRWCFWNAVWAAAADFLINGHKIMKNSSQQCTEPQVTSSMCWLRWLKRFNLQSHKIRPHVH